MSYILLSGGNAHSDRFLVSGGQTLDDSFKYIRGQDRLGLAVDSLKWRHIAPTAPDTLCMSVVSIIYLLTYYIGCYPFTDKDPFILSECPHVFVNGNQDSFASELVDGEY